MIAKHIVEAGARLRPRATAWRHNVATCIENVCESGCACLVTMAQGNLLALTAAHWLTASQTGLIAGAVASGAIMAARLRRPWIVSPLLGVVTAAVDFMIHPGHIGTAAATEAVVTGAGATVLSVALGLVWRRLRRRIHITSRTNAAAAPMTVGDLHRDVRAVE